MTLSCSQPDHRIAILSAVFSSISSGQRWQPYFLNFIYSLISELLEIVSSLNSILTPFSPDLSLNLKVNLLSLG